MTDKSPTNNDSLLKFPCDFTIKIFGIASDEFENEVFSIIRKYVPSLSDCVIQSRPSKQGKYSALTITVHVDSKEQLDNIYRALSASPKVIMAL